MFFIWKNRPIGTLLGADEWNQGWVVILRKEIDLKYSIEQDEETGKYCVYDSESGEKLSEWDTRRQATREMGRLNAEDGKTPPAEDPKKKDSSRSLDDEHDMPH